MSLDRLIHWLTRLFSLLGGAVAWGAQLLLTANLVSTGCRGGASGSTTGGVPALVLMLLMACVAAAASVVSWQMGQRSAGRQRGGARGEGASFLAVGGIYLNLLFLFAIVATGINATSVKSGCS